MSKVTTFDPAADEPADYKEAVIKCIEKIDSLREQMAEDQEEIDSLRTETQQILERLKAA
jgi:uncharacterized coiled-coil DUF342 family protein